MNSKSVCIFTIVTRSYYALALSLFKSIENNSKYPGNYYKKFIVVIDFDEDKFTFEKYSDIEIVPAFKIFEKNPDLFRSMSFKYDITEFCTSIKPHSFLYLFENYDCESIFFFDPDICFFSDIEQIIDDHGKFSISLTPHIINFEPGDSLLYRLLGSGVYNLGYVGISNHTESFAFLQWWKIYCENACYREPIENLFTDQKYLDFIFSFFRKEKVNIFNNPGYNVAPWNLFERKIFKKNSQFYVSCKTYSYNSPLVFFHFSGFDYSNLKSIESNNKFLLDNPGKEIENLASIYDSYLKSSNFIFYSSLPYNFSFFSINNQPINKIHRRLYRSMLDNYQLFKSDNPYKNKFLSDISLGKNEINLDSLNDKSDIKKFDKLDFILKYIMILIRMILGWRRYLMFLKWLKYISKYENQVFQIKRS